MKNGTCAKCGSNNIMADVKVRDVGNAGPYPLRVEVEEPEPNLPSYTRAIWRTCVPFTNWANNQER